MAKISVGDVVHLKEPSLAADGFVAGEEVVIENISDGPGELNIEISNEAGEVGYVSISHLDVDDSDDLRKVMDDIRYSKLPNDEGLKAIIAVDMLLDNFGEPDEVTDFYDGDLVEVDWIDAGASSRFDVVAGDYAYCLVAGGQGYGVFTDGHHVFAARAKLALSAKEHPVDERRLP